MHTSTNINRFDDLLKSHQFAKFAKLIASWHKTVVECHLGLVLGLWQG